MEIINSGNPKSKTTIPLCIVLIFAGSCNLENNIVPSLLLVIYNNTVFLGVKLLHVSCPLNFTSAACNECLVAPWNSAVTCCVVCFCLITQLSINSYFIVQFSCNIIITRKIKKI